MSCRAKALRRPWRVRWCVLKWLGDIEVAAASPGPISPDLGLI
jgi:hypothetical protein